MPARILNPWGGDHRTCRHAPTSNGYFTLESLFVGAHCAYAAQGSTGLLRRLLKRRPSDVFEAKTQSEFYASNEVARRQSPQAHGIASWWTARFVPGGCCNTGGPSSSGCCAKAAAKAGRTCSRYSLKRSGCLVNIGVNLIAQSANKANRGVTTVFKQATNCRQALII